MEFLKIFIYVRDVMISYCDLMDKYKKENKKG